MRNRWVPGWANSVIYALRRHGTKECPADHYLREIGKDPAKIGVVTKLQLERNINGTVRKVGPVEPILLWGDLEELIRFIDTERSKIGYRYLYIWMKGVHKHATFIKDWTNEEIDVLVMACKRVRELIVEMTSRKGGQLSKVCDYTAEVDKRLPGVLAALEEMRPHG